MVKEFKWDDDLVKEFGKLCHQDGWHKFHGRSIINTLIEEFKASKQKPLEYEILDFKDGSSVSAAERGIKSVRRLNDGEVFTIGNYCIEGNIKELHLNANSDAILAYFHSDECVCVIDLFYLQKVEPEKQPVLCLDIL